MNKILSSLLIVIALNSLSLTEIIATGNFSGVELNVEQATYTRTVISVEIGSFERTTVEIDGQTYFNLRLGGEPNIHEKGAPALPYLCRSIVIPDDAAMKINIIKSEYVEYESLPVAPAKGHIKRSINPADVPYSFDEIYSGDKWYPAKQGALREPYILRDIRGVVVEFYPFQYNPATKTLRVYTKLEVEVIADGIGSTNVLHRDTPFTSVEPNFKQLYENHFINYESGALLYTPVEETGDMLIITYDDFYDAITPLVEWKRQKGIQTTVVNISSIGNNSNSIANFIQAFYDSTDLAWVLLVGDADEIATPYSSGGSSDPSYAKVAGSDDYPDCFIGRFSAESTDHIDTQIERTINYEKYPQSSADWYYHATGIASDEGPGHYNEYDDEHLDYIRDDLLSYTFTTVDQIYDPFATSRMVSDSLNLGRSFINYIGHGSATSWYTSDYSNSDINNLTNDYMLPFIFSVACNNGTFDGNTCFAEAWLRATNSSTGNPTGAMATYMSSISQDWDPPMYAQDEANDLLISGTMLTFGGICYNGACYMIDIEYTSGVTHFDTWNIFGDPSVWLTTASPQVMSVVHDEAMMFDDTQLTVTTNVAGALCALYYEGILYGSQLTDNSGQAVTFINQDMPVNAAMKLTVSAPNKITYLGEITTLVSSGAYVVYDTYTIDDCLGNNNGVVDFGETISLDMQLENVGLDNAFSVSAMLSSPDSFVTITDSTESFGDIAGNYSAVNISDAYTFEIEENTPDAHTIQFNLVISGNSLETWESNFSITNHAPVIEFVDCQIDDSAGNNNSILEANETVNLVIILSNNGNGDSYNLSGILSENDVYVTIDDSTGTFGDIYSGEDNDNSIDIFTITAADDLPQGHIVEFTLALTGDYGLVAEVPFSVHTAESFEFSNGSYTGAGDWQWGEPSSGPNEAYYGTKVWATTLDGNYSNSTTSNLTGTQFHVYSDEAQLEFYHWYSIENYWDGGNVQISSDSGSSWEVITPVGDYLLSDIYSLGGPGYCNESGGWKRSVFDIGSYEGQDVIIRWHFISDSYQAQDGWYIDDVAVINNLPQSPELSYSPESICDTLEAGGQTTIDIIITNGGDSDLDFLLSSTASWISLDNTEHSLSPEQTDTLTVTISANSLEPGAYTDTIMISSNDQDNETEVIPVNLTVISAYSCEYVPGDVNGDEQVAGGDVTYAINYFRGIGNCPPDSCYNDQNEVWLYVAGDTNGDCMFIGGDVTYLINYFRGIVTSLNYCEDLPPDDDVGESLTREISIQSESDSQLINIKSQE